MKSVLQSHYYRYCIMQVLTLDGTVVLADPEITIITLG